MEESAVAAFKAEMCNTPDDILDTKLSSRSLGGSVTMLLQYLKQFVAKELPECMESIHAGQVDGDAARLHHVRPPVAANITASLPTLALTCSYTSTAPCLRTHLYHRSAARTRQHTL